MEKMLYAKDCGLEKNESIFYYCDKFYINNQDYFYDELIQLIKKNNYDVYSKYINIINDLKNGIGIEFDSETFDWKNNSWAIARFYFKCFDPDKFNWNDFSWAVAQYCPEHFNAEKYNWENHSWAIIDYCPEYFDPKKYNWIKDSADIAIYCPKLLDPEKFNWKDAGWAVIKYCPYLYDETKDEFWNKFYL